MGITFRGGVHPVGHKELSKDVPFETYLPHGEMIYPLGQHIGRPASPVVKKGDHVLVGQVIAEASAFVSANIHSGCSGTVKAVDKHRTVAGTMSQCVIIENDGPYLVQCTEGKDRTGFVCMLLEALCGADYNEIVDDYMISFNNYGGITRESDPDRYNILVESLLDPMIRIVLDDPEIDVTTADLSEGAENYLKSIGLTDAEIDKLKAQLT